MYALAHFCYDEIIMTRIENLNTDSYIITAWTVYLIEE